MKKFEEYSKKGQHLLLRIFAATIAMNGKTNKEKKVIATTASKSIAKDPSC